MELIKTQNGYLTILTGKTDMGKSTITVYDCSEQIKAGKSVLFFSFEYCQCIIYNKLITHFGLKWQDLFKLNVIDASNLNLQNVIETIKAKKGQVDTVYIDYLDLLRNATYPGSNDDVNMLNQIQTICRELAKVAKELEITIVLLSQVGSESTFEQTVDRLNAFTDKINEKNHNVIKMFIGKGNVIDSRINYDDIVHIILVEGYNLKHFSSINIKEVYKD